MSRRQGSEGYLCGRKGQHLIERIQFATQGTLRYELTTVSKDVEAHSIMIKHFVTLFFATALQRL